MDINDVIAPQTIESMTDALQTTTSPRRRAIIERALAAVPDTAAWFDAETELAGME